MNDKAEEMYEYVVDYMNDNDIEDVRDLDMSDCKEIAREIVRIALSEE